MRRIVERCCKVPFRGLGNEWRKFQELHETMGSFEFEVFVQTNLDSKKDAIKERGFYPSILLEATAVDTYLSNREDLLKSWSNPSMRYRDPYFTAIFPFEMSLTAEYLARIVKLNETPPEAGVYKPLFETYRWSVDAIAPTASGFWLMTEYSLEELQKNSVSSQWDKVKLDRAKSVNLTARRNIRREKWRAQVESCVTYARRYLENSTTLLDKVLIEDPAKHFSLGDDPKIVSLRNEYPLVVEVVKQLLSLKKPNKASTYQVIQGNEIIKDNENH